MTATSYGGPFEYLARSTVGVIFLGTPHRGTHTARWGDMVATCTKALGFGSEDAILKELRNDSDGPKDLLYEFTLWANRTSLTLVCFFEQHETDYGKRYGLKWKELVSHLEIPTRSDTFGPSIADTKTLIRSWVKILPA